MRTTLRFIAAAALGYGLALLVTAPLQQMLLGWYGAESGQTVRMTAMPWLGSAVMASAAVAAWVAPFVSPSASGRRWTAGTIAFTGSLALSVVVALMSVSCANAALAAPLSAEAAIAHADRWLIVGYLFAQIAVAGVMLVVRTHQDVRPASSRFASQGYAALETLGNRPA